MTSPTSAKRDLVVLGGGIAGLKTIESLRRGGYAKPITLVCGEAALPYDRPPLSKDILLRRRTTTELRANYDDLEVDVVLGDGARSLDPADKIVHLLSGTMLRYHTLVIATGADPLLPAAMASAPQIRTLRTMAHAVALSGELTPGARVAVVGGGLIGCEVASSARHQGCEVTVVEALSHPMQGAIGPAAAAALRSLYIEHEVTLLTDSCALAVTRCGDGVEVAVSGDERVVADVVVVGLGSAPTIGWLDGTDVTCDRGVLCDEQGRTSAPDVYAVGDVAQWLDARTGAHRLDQHWTNAVEQARVVASTILDRPIPKRASVPYFWSDQFGLRIQGLGMIDPDHAMVPVESSDRRMFLHHDADGHLTSVVGVDAHLVLPRLRPLLEAGSPIEQARELVRAALT